MTGTKTNELPGTKAQLRTVRFSASKARVVLNLIRGKHIAEASQILAFSERGAAFDVAKVLQSAVANAVNNDDADPNELYVSACFADEGPTMKRFRPRARGRAGPIMKQTCHITVIVSRMDDDRLEILQAKAAKAGTSSPSADRSARVAKSKAADEVAEVADADEVVEADEVTETPEAVEAEATEAVDAEVIDAEVVDEGLDAEAAEAVEEDAVEEVAVVEDAVEEATDGEDA